MTDDKKPEPTPAPPKKFLTDRERALINAKRLAKECKKGRK